MKKKNTHYTQPQGWVRVCVNNYLLPSLTARTRQRCRIGQESKIKYNPTHSPHLSAALLRTAESLQLRALRRARNEWRISDMILRVTPNRILWRILNRMLKQIWDKILIIPDWILRKITKLIQRISDKILKRIQNRIEGESYTELWGKSRTIC